MTQIGCQAWIRAHFRNYDNLMRPRGCPPAFLGTPVGFCLHDNPFVYKVRTLNVERRSETITCTIRTGPVYGLEVAILGVQLSMAPNRSSTITSAIATAMSSLPAALRTTVRPIVPSLKHGNRPRVSRLNPFTPLTAGYGVSHTLALPTPALLYVHNSNGLIANARSQDSSNASTRQMQAQFDALQLKVDSGAPPARLRHTGGPTGTHGPANAGQRPGYRSFHSRPFDCDVGNYMPPGHHIAAHHSQS